MIASKLYIVNLQISILFVLVHFRTSLDNQYAKEALAAKKAPDILEQDEEFSTISLIAMTGLISTTQSLSWG